VTDRPYTDDDLRAVAALLLAGAARDTDDMVRPVVERKWGKQATPDVIDEACDELVSLLDSAVDTSRWAVDIGARYLKQTTVLAWGHGEAWDLALQIAHRPGISGDLHNAIVGAARGAIQLVLDNRGLGLPQTT
jgi:hypothetical protein